VGIQCNRSVALAELTLPSDIVRSRVGHIVLLRLYWWGECRRYHLVSSLVWDQAGSLRCSYRVSVANLPGVQTLLASNFGAL